MQSTDRDRDLPADADHAIVWRNQHLYLLDQRVLPHQEQYLELTNAAETAAAIRDMVVRGAPAIGISAAYGCVLAARQRYADSPGDWKQQAGKLMADLIGPDADLLRLPVDDVGRVIRLLTFAGSHPHISENRLLSPEEIVDIVLDGVRLRDDAAYRTDSHPEED